MTRRAAPHGTPGRYRYWGCRCPACGEANRLYEKRRQTGRQPSAFVNAAGTVRRVQGLVAVGFTYGDIAAELGATPSWVNDLAHSGRPRGVLRRTERDVRNACRRLLAGPPPQGRGAAYARTVARRRGWVSLLAWDDIDDPDAAPILDADEEVDPEAVDEVAVRRVVDGHATLGSLRTKAEKAAAVARLLRRQSLGTIARHVGCSHSTVRYYAELAPNSGQQAA